MMYAAIYEPRVRVANELGAESNRGAKFATKVSLLNSITVGIIFFSLVMLLPNKFAMIFTSSAPVIRMVDELSSFLATTILLNSIQSILSGEETSKPTNLMIQLEILYSIRGN